jgi:hypothetical protein
MKRKSDSGGEEKAREIDNNAKAKANATQKRNQNESNRNTKASNAKEKGMWNREDAKAKARVK